MTKQTVLLLGATGETGRSILDGLLADPNSFHVEALVRPSSAEKPEVKKLGERGVKIRVADIDGALDDLVAALAGVDVLISAIDATRQLAQLQLATAAKQAGVQRFVPCAFITIAPPGGVMALRDSKEQVYQHIRKLYLPYTIIDVGYWHQISIPALPASEAHGRHPRRGTAPTMLGDLRDIGRYVALIIKDARTLNKFVAAYSDVLSENEIFALSLMTSSDALDNDVYSKYN
ncbi:hypothetical protein GGX14DRAFT_533307 [Mycena pura]|uniref:NmrA-like domain-containing protein n=1 Tax=Mycena pura TaxID=153505 RepID=A0AAD6YK57_9AGAR|nr:hypothetical protein GGX14DRAFT_533307 [Mycena pura]